MLLGLISHSFIGIKKHIKKIKKNTKLFNPIFFLKRSINIKNITNTKANSLFVSPNNKAAPI